MRRAAFAEGRWQTRSASGDLQHHVSARVEQAMEDFKRQDPFVVAGAKDDAPRCWRAPAEMLRRPCVRDPPARNRRSSMYPRTTARRVRSQPRFQSSRSPAKRSVVTGRELGIDVHAHRARVSGGQQGVCNSSLRRSSRSAHWSFSSAPPCSQTMRSAKPARRLETS
jgi:hypothetical protein